MLKTVFLCCLAVSAVPAMAADEEDGVQYRGWCTRSAVTDKITANERDDYVKACMSSLAEADRKPDRAARKGRDGGDDEG